MSGWIIPYIDQPPAFWHEIGVRVGAHIKEVYFPLPGFASGRGRQPDRYLEVFLKNAPFAKSVLVNPIVLPRPVSELGLPLIEVLRRLQGESGIQRVVVTDATLAQLIKETLPDFRITASVLMGIKQPAQVNMVQGYIDAIVVDNSLVRDLRGLKRLREAFAGELRLIVNEACLPGCVYRTQHFFEMGYGDVMPQSLCQPMLQARPWLRFTGAWILPQHLYHYDGLIDGFKLAGRVTLRNPEKYFTVLRAYINREPLRPKDIGGGPASVLEPMDVPDSVYKFILHCDKACHTCSFCRDFYAQAIAKKETAYDELTWST